MFSLSFIIFEPILILTDLSEIASELSVLAKNKIKPMNQYIKDDINNKILKETNPVWTDSKCYIFVFS